MREEAEGSEQQALETKEEVQSAANTPNHAIQKEIITSMQDITLRRSAGDHARLKLR